MFELQFFAGFNGVGNEKLPLVSMELLKKIKG